MIPSKPVTILLDTNFLMVPAVFGVDIFSEIDRCCTFKYALAVISPSLVELERLARENRTRAAATLALRFIKAKHINILPTAVKHTDDALVAYVRQHKECIIATQDKKLRERLKKAGVSVMVLRQKKYVKVL